jgi:hypothetical protein
MTPQEQAVEIAKRLGKELSATGVPFICIIGIPENMTLRMSKGLDNPEVNLRMRLEVERYALFMAQGGRGN